MNKFSLLAIFSAVFFSVTLNAQDKGGVAIVDMDAVAKELGISDAVITKLKSTSENLNGQLAEAKKQLQIQMNQAETKVSQEITIQGRQQLLNFNKQLNDKYDQLQSQARQAITQARVQEVRDFQEKLKPIALATAKEKGFQVVFMKVSPPLFAFAEEVDITDEVIAAAKKAGIKPEPVEAAKEATEGSPEDDAKEKVKAK